MAVSTAGSLVGIARATSAGIVNPQGNGDQVRLHAQQSRINFDARSNTEYGTVRAFIEGDFYGTGGNETISNSGALRLRHAFVQFGNLLAGQTWSTFMGLAALADTVDFGGPGAVTFLRQAQLRWTQPMGNGVSLSVAIENPENMDVRTAALGALVNDELPDFVAALNVSQSWGSVQLAGVVRELRATFIGAGAASDDLGWAVSLTGRINVPIANGNDNIRFSAIYSDGGSRYILDSAVLSIVNAGTEGQRERNALGNPIESYGLAAAYQHFWMDNLRSSLVGSYVEIDNLTAATSAKSTRQIYGNLIWSPVPRVDIGAELGWHELELLNGTTADMLRLQFAISRSF
ncbi:MAG: porin, partial [Fimbriimonadaceae bacterium]|nr:porin [Alphaproteobacteria bacterium]